MNDQLDDNEDEEGGIQPEVLASYLAFAKRAILSRRWLVITVFAVVSGLALGILAIWPRTYHCETRLMTQASKALTQDGDTGVRDALNFKGAYEIVMRQENIVSIVRQTNLVKHWGEARPFALRIKDSLSSALRGKPSDKDMEPVLVATLQTRLQVQVQDGVLTISIDWPEPRMAARILEVATQNFLEARHVTEISTIADYIAILEGHAVRIRKEIDLSVEQIERLREQKLAQYGRKADGAVATTPPAASAGADPDSPAPRAAPRPRAPAPADEGEIARLKVMLEAKQRALTELEDNRSRRLVEQQSKLRELSVKFTEAHPLVEDAKQSVRSLSEDSQQVIALRNEIQGLQADYDRKRALAGDTTPSTGTGQRRRSTATTTASAEPLPPEILRFMQDSTGDTFDPAVAAQFRHSVEKYTSLRGTIATARIDLDTAQAAFQYRYKVMVPPEAPNKPIKPKASLIAIGAIIGGILIALLVAIGAELRSDRIVERWQVYQLSLPVLSELRLPDYRKH